MELLRDEFGISKCKLEKNRYRTNPYWVYIFITFLAVWISVAIFAVNTGDINKILNDSYDSDGRLCGIDDEVKTKPYIFYLDFDKCEELDVSCKTKGVCLSKCPENSFEYKRENGSLEEMKRKLLCTNGVIKSINDWDTLDKHIKDGNCAKWYLKSISTNVGKICLPQKDWDIFEIHSYTSYNSFRTQQVWNKSDDRFLHEEIDNFLTANKNIAGLFMACSGVVSLIYMILLRWLATPITFATILVICAFLIYGMYSMAVLHSTDSLWSSVGSVAGVIACIAILIIIIYAVSHYADQIHLACAMIKQSTRTVLSIPYSLLFPILPGILQFLILALGIKIALCLYTIKVPVYQVQILNDTCKCSLPTSLIDKEACDPHNFAATYCGCFLSRCQFVDAVKPWYLNILHMINMLGCYWLYSFVSAFNEMTLAGAFANWHWASDKKTLSYTIIVDSIVRIVRFHIGTLAFGSLILTGSQIICFFHKKIIKTFLESHSGLNFFFDKFFKFINRKVYIVCAIRGKDFYNSMVDSFDTNKNHSVADMLTEKIMHWILFTGRLSTVLLIGAFAEYYEQSVLFIVLVGVYIISTSFISLYKIAAETISFCVHEDSNSVL